VDRLFQSSLKKNGWPVKGERGHLKGVGVIIEGWVGENPRRKFAQERGGGLEENIPCKK